VVLADTETHGDLGRLVNALSTADDFREHGDEVTIIFDGAGVRWAAELSKPDHRLHERFEALRDVVAGACHYCAGAFEARGTRADWLPAPPRPQRPSKPSHSRTRRLRGDHVLAPTTRKSRAARDHLVPTDEHGRVDGRVLMAIGLLIDALALAGMCAAIVFSSGAALALSIIAGNMLLIVGFLIAYRGRIRSDPD
jgi:hypothetical protein